MSVLAHREVDSGLYPRHPIVCVLDMMGFVITTVLLATYPQKLVVAALPISIATLYVASLSYHWLPFDPIRQKIDHLMIATVIAATYVPFWGTVLSVDIALPRFLILGLMFGGVAVMKLFFIEWHKTGGVLFFLLGLYGVATSFFEVGVWLPPSGHGLFWLGVSLYMAQMAAYALRWPNLLPERFGFREAQHTLLLGATTTHTFVVLNYL